LLLVLGTCWLAFTPSPVPEIDTGWDKLNHWLAFASMAFSACFAFALARHRLLKVMLALLAFGVVIELVQSQIPGRDADALDVLADAIGIGGGLLLVWIHDRLRRR
jgi:VanZ family protein